MGVYDEESFGRPLAGQYHVFGYVCHHVCAWKQTTLHLVPSLLPYVCPSDQFRLCGLLARQGYVANTFTHQATYYLRQRRHLQLRLVLTYRYAPS